MAVLRAALATAVLAAVGMPWPWSSPEQVPSAVESRLELVVQEIYDIAEWAQRVPYDIALPLIARSKIRSYVSELDLEDETRERILERLDSRGFVDELVPFVLALRDVYGDAGDAGVERFDTWLRRSFRPTGQLPGFEHSMFAWEPERKDDAADAASGLFDSELAAELVEFYDALYLQEAGAAAELDDQLACASRDSDATRAPAAKRVQPVVRELLETVRGRVAADGDVAAAIDDVLANDRALATVSISVVHFLDVLVCRHYRIFATQVMRQRQLESWMLAELDKPGAGQLWAFLEQSARRRHAALIVVDGLQGHLMQALAGGDSGDVFLRRTLAEYDRGLAARLKGAKPAPAQRIDFLRSAVAGGVPRANYLRYFADLYASPRGIAEQGVSTTPTISVRNLPIAKTGAAVAGPHSTSIPNFHFVDRHFRREGETTGRAYYFYGNDALQLEPLAHEAGLRTLFDRLPRRSSFSCAAQYDAGAHYRLDAFLNLALGEGMRDFGEVRCIGELRRRATNQLELREARAELLDKRTVLSARFDWYQALRRSSQSDEKMLAARLIARIAELEQQSMPELLLYYNPWPDHFAHFAGPFADEILAPSGELNRLDYWLAQLAGVYRAAGIADRTLFAMTGDHGLTPVFLIVNPEVEVFGRLADRGIRFDIVKISSDEGEGPKMTHPLDPPSMRGHDAVVASTAGGNYMIDLFVDQGDQWTRQPVLEELRSLRLIDGDAPIDIVAEIGRSLEESLDYLVVRVTPCGPAGGEIAVIGQRGGSLATTKIVRRGDLIFCDTDGADLLDLEGLTPYETLSPARRAEHRVMLQRCLRDANRDDPETWCTESQWRRLTSYTPRPDSVVQLAHLYDTDRAGTINLFPRAGVGYNTVVPGRHAGETFHEKDAFVGLWGVPVTRKTRPRVAVIGSVPATVFAYLAEQSVAAGSDGWGYSSIPLADGVRGADD